MAWEKIDEVADAYFGNCFMPNVAEGVVLPLAANRFVYPHPRHSIDDLLPPVPASLAAAA